MTHEPCPVTHDLPSVSVITLSASRTVACTSRQFSPRVLPVQSDDAVPRSTAVFRSVPFTALFIGASLRSIAVQEQAALITAAGQPGVPASSHKVCLLCAWTSESTT